MSAIEGFVPRDVVRCFRAYLDFCYIARMNVFTRSTLDRLDEALERFHMCRTIFQRLGVRDPNPSGLSLPRQHAMIHYRQHIENFDAPNGLCSSITESKHIIAVKRPWRRSSHYNPISQIMLINQRMEKLAAARVHFASRGMLDFPTWQPRLPYPVPSDDDEDQSGAAHEGAFHNEVFLAQTHGALRSRPLSATPIDAIDGSSQLSTQPPWSRPENRPPEPTRSGPEISFPANLSRPRPQRRPAPHSAPPYQPLPCRAP